MGLVKYPWAFGINVCSLLICWCVCSALPLNEFNSKFKKVRADDIPIHAIISLKVQCLSLTFHKHEKSPFLQSIIPPIITIPPFPAVTRTRSPIRHNKTPASHLSRDPWLIMTSVPSIDPWLTRSTHPFSSHWSHDLHLHNDFNVHSLHGVLGNTVKMEGDGRRIQIHFFSAYSLSWRQTLRHFFQ